MNNENLTFLKSALLLSIGASADIITEINNYNVILEFIIKITSLISFVLFFVINWNKIKEGFKNILNK